ncbi:MAG: hypothetical protein ACC641_10555 [Acidiferrobacterales bacterium]
MRIHGISFRANIVVMLLTFSSPAVLGGWFDETTVTPIVGITNNTLDYRRAAASGDRNTTFNSLSVKLGIAGNKWFGSVSGEFPLAPGRFTGGAASSDVIRSDYSVSIGYPVLPRISVFGGYLLTNIRLANSLFTENQNDAGPYVGTSIDVYRGNSSTVSINAAYANLNGTAVRDGGSGFDVYGTTTGSSFGVTWTGKLGKDGRTYILSYKNQNFKFNGNSGTNAPQTIDKAYSVVTIAILL